MKENNLYEWILQQLHDDKIEECYNYLNNNPMLSGKLWDDTLEYNPKEIYFC